MKRFVQGPARHVLVACGLLASACSAEPTAETPEGALTLFLDAMERSEWDDTALEDAYRLLSPEARTGLDDRASMASALAGRDFQPWQMLAQGRYRRRFAPRGAMEVRTEGDTAIVTVRGESEGQTAEVPLVREGNEWRIVLHLPPMRPDAVQ